MWGNAEFCQKLGVIFLCCEIPALVINKEMNYCTGRPIKTEDPIPAHQAFIVLFIEISGIHKLFSFLLSSLEPLNSSNFPFKFFQISPKLLPNSKPKLSGYFKNNSLPQLLRWYVDS